MRLTLEQPLVLVETNGVDESALLKNPMLAMGEGLERAAYSPALRETSWADEPVVFNATAASGGAAEQAGHSPLRRMWYVISGSGSSGGGEKMPPVLGHSGQTPGYNGVGSGNSHFPNGDIDTNYDGGEDSVGWWEPGIQSLSETSPQPEK